MELLIKQGMFSAGILLLTINAQMSRRKITRLCSMMKTNFIKL